VDDGQKLVQRSDAKAYFWLVAFGLLGFPAKANDFSIPHYVINFGAACVVFFLGTIASRAMSQETVFRDPVRLLALVGVLALLLFPMRSEGTPIWMFALVFGALYIAVLAALMIYKKFNR
jgi:hypothetical protein